MNSPQHQSPLSREQLIVAAAQLSAATLEKDPSIAEHLALLEGVKDAYELGALHFFRYLRALEKLAQQPLD
jgi:hypothetical protein